MGNIWFKKENKLDEFFDDSCAFTVSIEDLLDFIEGKKFEAIKECGCAFKDGVFVAYRWARDAEAFEKLRNIGCRSVGINKYDKNGEKLKDYKIVGLINNENFYGAVEIKILEYEDEYAKYIEDYGC